MAEIILQAEIRELKGKKVGSLRREGRIPGIYYIHGEDNLNISITEKSFTKLIHSKGISTINLTFGNGIEKKCIIKNIQFDPVTEKPIHVDFQGLRADEKLTIDVPVVITGGTPQGVRDGGMLQQIIHRLKISCLPGDIPSQIDVNAEKLLINQSIHVKDLVTENYTILENENSTIVAILPPLVEKEVSPAPTEEVAEPEVVAKGKKTTEEESNE